MQPTEQWVQTDFLISILPEKDLFTALAFVAPSGASDESAVNPPATRPDCFRNVRRLKDARGFSAGIDGVSREQPLLALKFWDILFKLISHCP